MAFPLPRTRRFATLARSWGLLRSFPDEQQAPDVFYSGLARDTRELIERLRLDITGQDLDGALVLDVGGGPGYFAQEFASRGAHYISVEPSAGEMAAAGIEVANAVRADGMNLPIASNSVDIAYSSNVAEHVPRPFALANELLRVTKPGGLAILSYTVWLGPFGGHETGLWQHYVGGHFARERYTRTHGHLPKNSFGTSLFKVSCAEGLSWAQATGQLVAAFPRYHPSWAWWLVRVPVLREFLVSNLVVVLRKR